MSDNLRSRERYGEAFWRAHHEAWIESELNQREYCEAYGIPLKAFGNWRAKFKAEPQPLARKVLYRRGSLSHALSHGLSHGFSHDLPGSGPIVPPAREGRRRRFVDTYLEPNKSFLELREMANSGSIDLLRDFSETCRAEFESLRTQF